jgi:hypothetical protein
MLSDRKKLVLGTKPVLLRPFTGGAPSHAHSGRTPPAGTTTANAADHVHAANGSAAAGGVFAACDRPAVLFSSNGKIMYANLNESNVSDGGSK